MILHMNRSANRVGRDNVACLRVATCHTALLTRTGDSVAALMRMDGVLVGRRSAWNPHSQETPIRLERQDGLEQRGLERDAAE